jgi:hypothetical protein
MLLHNRLPTLKQQVFHKNLIVGLISENVNQIISKKASRSLKGVVGVNGTSVEENFCFIPEFS